MISIFIWPADFCVYTVGDHLIFFKFFLAHTLFQFGLVAIIYLELESHSVSSLLGC